MGGLPKEGEVLERVCGLGPSMLRSSPLGSWHGAHQPHIQAETCQTCALMPSDTHWLHEEQVTATL